MTANMNNVEEKRVTVKVALGGELRRFQFEGSSINKLVAQLKEIFGIDAAAVFSVTYKDDEGDMITMSSDGELTEALAVSPGGILRLRIVLKSAQGAAQSPVPVADPAATACHAQWHKDHKAAWMMKKEMMKERRKEWLERKFEKARAEGKLVARHVKDVTIADGTELPPNTPFAKTWRVRNESVQWPAGCKLIFVGRNSDRMGGPEFVSLAEPVEPQQEVDVSVPLTSPAEPGRYVGFWRLCAPDGRKFGQRLWVSITVTSPSSSSSDEGFVSVNVNANANPAPDAAKFEELATKVEAMGFLVPRKRIVRMLMKFGGDVDKVAEILTKKNKGLKCGRHGKHFF